MPWIFWVNIPFQGMCGNWKISSKEASLSRHPTLSFPKASPSPMRESGAGSKRRRRSGLSLEGIKLDDVLAEIEKEYLVKALEMARGSKYKATELLGISMRSLRYRLEKLEIPSEDVS